LRVKGVWYPTMIAKISERFCFLYVYGRVERSVFTERYFVLGSLNVAVGVVGLIGGINAIKKRSYYVSIGCGVVPLIFIVLTLLFLEFPLLNLWSLIFWTVGLNLIAFSSEDFKKNS